MLADYPTLSTNSHNDIGDVMGKLHFNSEEIKSRHATTYTHIYLCMDFEKDLFIEIKLVEKFTPRFKCWTMRK